MNSKNRWHSIKGIPNDLITAKEILFDNNNFEYSMPVIEAESLEYGACTFKLNGLNVRFRIAKITPTKTGQFVTLWKRLNDGPIQPFDATDPIDLFIVSTRKDNRLGHFVFPMSTLIEKRIVTFNGKEGKRGIRVYPPWDATMSKQAQKTQNWQLAYFIEFEKQELLNNVFLKKLYFK